jgi:site-specific DNA recombinase
MKPVEAVAIYARISSDQDGTALGVARQVQDCRGLAKSLGWVVAEEYVDNDLSAFSGKRRPGYEAIWPTCATASETRWSCITPTG